MVSVIPIVLSWAVAAGGPAPATVSRVDLDRYQGRWYEVARYPNRFQNACASDVVADYARRADGRIDVENRCATREGGITVAKGLARLATTDGSNAKLEVRFAPAFLSFIPAVWGDYWILGLADDYSYAVVGSPDRKYLWFLSRTPAISDDVFTRLMEIAARQGFDRARIARTRHGSR